MNNDKELNYICEKLFEDMEKELNRMNERIVRELKGKRRVK